MRQALVLVPKAETTQYIIFLKCNPASTFNTKHGVTVTVLGGWILTSSPPFSVSVSCLINQKGRTRSFLRSLPVLTFCDSKTQGGPPDSCWSFQSIPDVCFSVGLESVSVRGCRQGGDTKPNDEASMGTALTTSSGLEPIQGTLIWANCAYLLMNLPRKCSRTFRCLLTSATNFIHHLNCPFLSWHSLASRRTPGPHQMSGLYLCSTDCLVLSRAMCWQRYYHPEQKYSTTTRQWKHLLEVYAVNAEKQNSINYPEKLLCTFI